MAQLRYRNGVLGQFGPLSEDLDEPNVRHQHGGIVRTSMNCHACAHSFLAEIDHTVDASIIISCPHCLHKHYRMVKDGIVTDERHGYGDNNEKFVAKIKTWKHPTIPAKASTTSEFLRNRWLNLTNRPR